MLSTLFPHVHRRYAASPFATDLDAFASWLWAVGYSHTSTCDHVCRLHRTFARIAGLAPGASFTEAQLQHAFRSRSSPARYRGTQRAFARFLTHVGRLTVPPPSTDRLTILRAGYCQSVAELRGLAGQTIRQHDSTLKDFLARGLGLQGLAGLTRDAIDRYVQCRSQEVSRPTLQHVVARLRGFLRYCYDQGEILHPLDAIDTPRVYRGELPPRAIAWGLVLKLLRSVDRYSRAGWRDAAILHLMAFYGLRPSEIATLQVASIDWVAKTLRVEQRKTRSIQLLPLADRTLRLLQRYLRQGRPVSEHPHLFLRARCPAGALTHYAVVDLFEKRARLSGLPLDGTSSYGLRHALAMRLLHRGVGVKAIGDVLGHRSLESTCVYLRIHTDMLRAVALPVPHVGSRPRRQS